MSRYPYHQELTVRRDQEPPSHAVSPGVVQVAPSVYGLHVFGSGLSTNRSSMPLDLRHHCCRAALVIVEVVQKLL